MSAFVHGNDHIDFLVTYLCNCEHGAGITTVYRGKSFFQSLDKDMTPADGDYAPDGIRPARISPTQLGRLLLAENIRSVMARYENLPIQELEAYAMQLESYSYRPVNTAKMRLREEYDRAAIVAARSYAHQTCETEDWPETDAAQWVNAIVSHAAVELSMPDVMETEAWSYTR